MTPLALLRIVAVVVLVVAVWAADGDLLGAALVALWLVVTIAVEADLLGDERRRHADTAEALRVMTRQRDAWRTRATYWHGETRRDAVDVLALPRAEEDPAR